MKHLLTLVVSICMIVFFSGMVFAEEGPATTVVDGCKKELESYCKEVSPGDGRLLACLYAYGDKLSGRCEYALYDAAAQLERAVAALTYVASECKDDLKAYCSTVRPGEGRLIECLGKNEKKVSDRCKQAFKDVSAK